MVKLYLCKMHRAMGETVCTNRTRRPVTDVDAALITWLKENVVTESFIITATSSDDARPGEAGRLLAPSPSSTA